MAERVPIAHFADPDTAHLAAGFLEIQGLDAVALEKTGFRAAGGGIVLVPRHQAVSAVALLHRAAKGDFANPHPDLTVEKAETLVDLTKALGRSSVRASWLHHLPIILIAAVVVLGIVGVMVAAILSDL